MRHLIMFENFQTKEVFEAAIPVFNELEFSSGMTTEPDFTAKYSELADIIEDFLEKKKSGEIEEVTVVADVPTQGKGAPEYVQDIIRKERERVAARMRAQGYNPEEDEIDIDRFGDKRNIFFDSEFVVAGVERDPAGKGDKIIGIPYSFYKKGDMTKKAYIDPLKVDEVFYKPVK